MLRELSKFLGQFMCSNVVLYLQILLALNILVTVFFILILGYVYLAIEETLKTAREYLHIKITLSGKNDYDKL